GPFATLLAHAVIARTERPARWRALAAPTPIRERGDAGGGPIVVVQCESFFDARRLSPSIPHDLLPGFDACCRRATQFGRLEVPGWGANTMRAEFAVLTGLADDALGYDRFNPYYALARVPLASQAWRLRASGYRTICLHPFDRRFFRRDLVMPALGFECFLGRETLGGGRRPPYCPDPELARHILRVLDEEGPRTFIFAITMGNHGPWNMAGPPLDPAVAALLDPAAMPDGGGLLRYLDGLRKSDEMLQVLIDGLARRGDRPTLAFYGDHLPSLSAVFRHFGFDEPCSDYVIWPGTGAPQRRDLPAHGLGRLVAEAALGRPAQDAAACRTAASASLAR
ncbi:MAG TPA: LTA synthase family protein, partial [Stellaceae bacterium]|nr:LTA synthase family protein [Stellaceae bacterium]